MRSELLFIVRVNPAEREVAIEVLSEIMTFAAFDVPIRLLFLDQGVILLSSGIDPDLAGMMKALPLYGVTELFVERESLEAMEIPYSNGELSLTPLFRADVPQFILQHQGLMSA